MFGGLPGTISPDMNVGRARRHTTASRASARRGVMLDDLIQGEIIPRLLVAHPAPAAPNSANGAVRIAPDEVKAFAPLPLSLEADELLRHVEQFLARGVSVESIFVDLLAPSARKLGQFWEDDACDFIDVTMGLWRLQEVMREVAMRVPAVTQALSEPRSALFSPLPGEQHSFGALMIEEVFARAGWNSEALIEPRRKDLLRTVAERNFDLVGLTVTNDCLSGALSDLITAIRGVSKNSAIQVFIGGRVVNANPGLAIEVGADGTAPDARSALALAE
ncbi:MAG: cobalamin B12-binding domain-containing protein, partial [Sphingomonadales bacterium]